MSHTITANEFGKVRVFQLNYALESEVGGAGDYHRLEHALGVTFANTEDVQIIAQAALDDLGLAQFLMMGHGISQAQITPEMDRLNALTGSFAIIRSGVFGGVAVTLADHDDAKLIATFTEEGAAPAPLTPLTSDSSKGTITPPDTPIKKPKSDARVGGMIATVALLLMGLLVWLMIWIAS
jgi:hypothetical protein